MKIIFTLPILVSDPPSNLSYSQFFTISSNQETPTHGSWDGPRHMLRAAWLPHHHLKTKVHKKGVTWTKPLRT